MRFLLTNPWMLNSNQSTTKFSDSKLDLFLLICFVQFVVDLIRNLNALLGLCKR